MTFLLSVTALTQFPPLFSLLTTVQTLELTTKTKGNGTALEESNLQTRVEQESINVTSSSNSKFFRVELIPNPPDKPFYQANALEDYQCLPLNRSPFPPELQSTLRSAYTPRLTTNMNLMVMGDSLGVQLSVLFQSVASRHSPILTNTHRVILGRSRGKYVYTMAQASGGGTIAGWRITGMLQETGLTQPLPLKPGGGWRLDMAEKMMNYSWHDSNTRVINAMSSDSNKKSSQPQQQQSTVVGSFDVMLFRIPQIWIPLQRVQHETLQETVQQAAQVFGVKTVIFMNLPIVNGYTETTELAATNQRVRSFVDDWQHNQSTANSNDASIPSVFLLELGTFITSIGMRNAERLGYNVSRPDFITELVANDLPRLKRSMALHCIERPNATNNGETCPLNMISFDGVHMCTETFGPRVVAGVACLVNCAKANDHAKCDRACNQEHMRLAPTQ